MEADVLKHLNFEIPVTTTKCFLRRFIRAAHLAERVMNPPPFPYPLYYLFDLLFLLMFNDGLLILWLSISFDVLAEFTIFTAIRISCLLCC